MQKLTFLFTYVIKNKNTTTKDVRILTQNGGFHEYFRSTRLCCPPCSPVSHSISPAMHNEAFQYHGLDYAYLAFEATEDTLPSAVEALKTLHVRGFNLTMPCKNRMVSLCDRLSPAAEISGSVNTVLFEDGILTGYTTDGIGYMDACRDAGIRDHRKKNDTFRSWRRCHVHPRPGSPGWRREITLFTRQPNRPRTQSIIEKLSCQTSCRIKAFSYEDAGLIRRELSDSAIW